MKSRWGRDFIRRDLEATERRNVVTESYRLTDEEVAQRILSRDDRVEAWKTRAWILFFAYIDRMAVFLCGFLLGYVLSALR